MSDLYQSLSHSKWDCEYHVVFVPQRRRRVLFVQVRVVCTIEAVWLGTKGGADGVVSKGLPPLKDLLAEFFGQRRQGLAVRGLHQTEKDYRCRPDPRSHHRGGGEAISRGATLITFA